MSTTQHCWGRGCRRACWLCGRSASTTPEISAWVVAAWLAGIIIDLLTLSGYYDIALRDFGLLLGAVALGLLARGVHTANAGPTAGN